MTAADRLLAVWTWVAWSMGRAGWRPFQATPELEGAILVLRAEAAEIRALVP